MKWRDAGRIHFIGAGGVGMSALIRYALDEGIKVSGSDTNGSDALASLRNSGADVYSGSDADRIKSAGLVVYSSAVHRGDAELSEARRLNIPTMERHEFLGAVSRDFDKVIAVAGTHGKTTATSMLAHILDALGANFTAFIGGDSVSFGNYVSRTGQGARILLSEACEYNRGFLSLAPDIALVLNVDDDHPDCYKDFGEISAAFAKFCRASKKTVLGEDAAAAFFNHICISKHIYISAHDNVKLIDRYADMRSNAAEDGTKIRKYKVFSDACVYTGEYDDTGAADRLQISADTYGNTGVVRHEDIGEAAFGIRGGYNAANALCAIAAAAEAGYGVRDAARALASFKGVKRRFECAGCVSGTPAVFDYAHHPTEIRNALSSARSYGRVLAVFQPHTYSRTARYIKDFVKELSRADGLVIAPTFAAREIPQDGADSVYLADRISEYTSAPVKVCGDLGEVCDEVQKRATGYDAVLLLGAGDIYSLKEKLTLT